jgi:hypothetical protein
MRIAEFKTPIKYHTLWSVPAYPAVAEQGFDRPRRCLLDDDQIFILSDGSSNGLSWPNLNNRLYWLGQFPPGRGSLWRSKEKN